MLHSGSSSRRLTALLLLLFTLGACKSAPTPASDVDPTRDTPRPEGASQCGPQRATDPMLALQRWMALERNALGLPTAAAELSAQWGTLHVVRAWRESDTEWRAVLSGEVEPAPDSQVLLIPIVRQGDAAWQVEPARAEGDARADARWPSL